MGSTPNIEVSSLRRGTKITRESLTTSAEEDLPRINGIRIAVPSARLFRNSTGSP